MESFLITALVQRNIILANIVVKEQEFRRDYFILEHVSNVCENQIVCEIIDLFSLLADWTW